MATTTFLGYPPAGIRSWIKDNTLPSEPLTPKPSLTDWSCSVSTMEPSTEIATCTLRYDEQKGAWTGSFSYNTNTVSLVLKQTYDGNSYAWTIAENGGTNSEIPSDDITPDSVNPTSISTRNMALSGSYVYNFTRTIN